MKKKLKTAVCPNCMKRTFEVVQNSQISGRPGAVRYFCTSCHHSSVIAGGRDGD